MLKMADELASRVPVIRALATGLCENCQDLRLGSTLDLDSRKPYNYGTVENMLAEPPCGGCRGIVALLSREPDPDDSGLGEGR